MNNEVVTVLDALSEKLGIAIDWSSENILPYIQEIYEGFVGRKSMLLIGIFIVSMLCIIVGIIFCVYYNKSVIVVERKEKESVLIEKYESFTDPTLLGWFLLSLSIIAMIAGVVGVIYSICSFLAFFPSPELYFLKYIGLFPMN